MKGLREHPPGSGYWELSFYNRRNKPPRKYVRFEASDETAAILIASDYVRAYQSGDYDPWSNAVDDIDQAVRDYLKAHQHQRPNTLKNKESILGRFLRSTKEKSFRKVGVDAINKFMAKTRKPGTKDTQSQVLNSFWKWCIDHGYAKKNPVQEWRKRAGIKAKRRTDRDGVMPEVAVQIIGVSTVHENYYPAMLELAFCTGLRKSELISLNVRDVTLSDAGGSIHVREWVHPETGFHFVPKYGRERVVPLVPRASALLRRLIDELRTDDPWRHIFGASSDPSIRVRENSPSNYFRDHRQALGLGPAHTFHSTRHSFVSWLIMCGADPYAVQEIAGHADLTTQQRYVHFSRVMLSGGASGVRREIVRFLCPSTTEEALAYAFPDSSTWYGSAVSGSRLDILDILFAGILYDKELIEALKRSEMRRSASRN